MEGSGRGHLKLLSRNFLGETKENHENLSQNSRSPGKNLNLGLPKQEAGMLTTQPRL
jgi:hypothetical protein